MKIADLDLETKALITIARSLVHHPNQETLLRLNRVVRAWEKKHENERAQNLLRSLDILTQSKTPAEEV